jgi:cytochrome c556
MLAVLLIAGIAAGPAGASSDEETPSIKKVMKKLNSGKNASVNKVKAALKGDSPSWSEIQKESKVIATLAATLPKNDPPRGDKESFEKLAKAFASAGKSLEESADKEDLTASREAMKKISTSCMPCHKSHRPN